MQTIQKVTPVLFAYIYFLVPAAVVIYMIVSTLIRILTQEIMFRTGMVQLGGGRAEDPGGDRAKGLTTAPAGGTGRGCTRGRRMTRSTKPRPRRGPKSERVRHRRRRAQLGKSEGLESNGRGSTNGATAAEAGAHPRARGKRPRKARESVEWVEISGATLEEAKELALEQLGVAEADAELIVLAGAQGRAVRPHAGRGPGASSSPTGRARDRSVSDGRARPGVGNGER